MTGCVDNRGGRHELSNEILEQAVEAWTEGKAQRRDNLLRVGRLLQEFVKQRLREGAGLNERERIESGTTRHAAITEAARRLGLHPDDARRGYLRVNELMRVAATADLLRPDGGLGVLAYANLRLFHVCVRRRGRGTAPQRGNQRRSRTLRPGEVEPWEKEDWEVRPGCEWGAEVLAQAIAERWTAGRIARVLAERRKPGSADEGSTLPDSPTDREKPESETEKVDHGEYSELIPERARVVIIKTNGHCLNYHNDVGSDGRDRPDIIRVARVGTISDLTELVARVVLESRDPEAARTAIEARMRSLRVPLRF